MCTVTPANYWPKNLSAKSFDAESRLIIKMQEHLRILDLRVTALEKKK